MPDSAVINLVDSRHPGYLSRDDRLAQVAIDLRWRRRVPSNLPGEVLRAGRPVGVQRPPAGDAGSQVRRGGHQRHPQRHLPADEGHHPQGRQQDVSERRQRLEPRRGPARGDDERLRRREGLDRVAGHGPGGRLRRCPVGPAELRPSPTPATSRRTSIGTTSKTSSVGPARSQKSRASSKRSCCGTR